RPPAEAVRDAAEEKGADGPQRQGESDAPGHRLDVGAEVARQAPQHENDEEEIERVEHPAEKARDDDVAVCRGPILVRAHAGPSGKRAAIIELRRLDRNAWLSRSAPAAPLGSLPGLVSGCGGLSARQRAKAN